MRLAQRFSNEAQLHGAPLLGRCAFFAILYLILALCFANPIALQFAAALAFFSLLMYGPQYLPFFFVSCALPFF